MAGFDDCPALRCQKGELEIGVLTNDLSLSGIVLAPYIIGQRAGDTVDPFREKDPEPIGPGNRWRWSHHEKNLPDRMKEGDAGPGPGRTVWNRDAGYETGREEKFKTLPIGFHVWKYLFLYCTLTFVREDCYN